MFDIFLEDGSINPFIAILAIITIMKVMEHAQEQFQPQHPEQAGRVGECLMEVLWNKYRGMYLDDGTDERPPKQRKNYDHNRAKQCITANWMEPQPLFDDQQFECTFWVTHHVADQILQVVKDTSPFFCNGTDATGKANIDPQVKLLMALKVLVYGNSPSAFLDFFQISKTTARHCVQNLTTILSQSNDVRELYLRSITRGDARQAASLHERIHGVPGKIGSMDCIHVAWQTCPVGWQGQFKGKEPGPAIVLKAVANHNLWIWHHAFGFASSLNDINIFDQSTLLQAFLDGTFTRDIDFEYEIDGKVFSELFVLVDGIYPEISRFVKTYEEPLTADRKRYAKWQEASRKDVERAFGVLQQKFHVLV